MLMEREMECEGERRAGFNNAAISTERVGGRRKKGSESCVPAVEG